MLMPYILVNPSQKEAVLGVSEELSYRTCDEKIYVTETEILLLYLPETSCYEYLMIRGIVCGSRWLIRSPRSLGHDRDLAPSRDVTSHKNIKISTFFRMKLASQYETQSPLTCAVLAHLWFDNMHVGPT